MRPHRAKCDPDDDMEDEPEVLWSDRFRDQQMARRWCRSANGVNTSAPPCIHPSGALLYSELIFGESGWGCGECQSAIKPRLGTETLSEYLAIKADGLYLDAVVLGSEAWPTVAPDHRDKAERIGRVCAAAQWTSSKELMDVWRNSMDSEGVLFLADGP